MLCRPAGELGLFIRGLAQGLLCMTTSREVITMTCAFGVLQERGGTYMKKSISVGSLLFYLPLLLCGPVWATMGTMHITRENPSGNIIVEVNGRSLTTDEIIIGTDEVTLKQDHFGNIILGADGITLNCANKEVNQDDGAVDYGIEIRGRTGVTVENCNILGPGKYGIYIHRAPDTLAEGITIDSCLIEGWEVGIKLGADDKDLGYDPNQVHGGHHRIWHNYLRKNSKDGLDCDGSSANDYWDNEAYHNGQNGFEFDNCHNSNDWGAPFIFENNRAHHNGKHGFSFDHSNNHRLHANASYCNGWVQDPHAPDSMLKCRGDQGVNPKPDKSDCKDPQTMKKIQIFGHGLRVDSSDCDGANPSTGIQADWNNWGDDGLGCGSNAVATYGYQVVVKGKLSDPKKGLDYAIIHCAVNDPLCQEMNSAGQKPVGDQGSTYDNMKKIYGYNTNHCSP